MILVGFESGDQHCLNVGDISCISCHSQSCVHANVFFVLVCYGLHICTYHKIMLPMPMEWESCVSYQPMHMCRKSENVITHTHVSFI